MSQWVLCGALHTGHDDLYVGQVVSYHLLELSLHLVRQHVVVPLWVVRLAVVPNQLDMVQHLLDGPVLPPLQLVLHPQQIHRMFDHQRVVIQLQL